MKSLQPDPMIVVRIVGKVGVAFLPTGKSAPMAALSPVGNRRCTAQPQATALPESATHGGHFLWKNAVRPVTGLKFHEKTGRSRCDASH
jgi:hypothetical protein